MTENVKKDVASPPMSAAAQWTVIGIVAAALVVVFALVVLFGGRKADAIEPPAPVGVVKPTPEQIASLTFAAAELRDFRAEANAEGKIATDDDHTTPVYSPYTGRVTKLFAEPGDRVAKGAPLFAIEANEFAQGHSDFAAAEAALEAARSQEALSAAAEKRAGELFKSGGGAQKDWLQAQHDLIAARGATQSALAADEAERSKLKILGMSEADINALGRNKSAETIVRAPIAGVIGKRSIGLGQLLSSGGDPAVTITDLSTVWLAAQVTEEDAGKVKVGQDLSVVTSAYPGRTFHARVIAIAPALDPDTHRLPVRAQIANPDGALKADMFATFKIYSSDVAHGVGVPSDAVIREGDESRVWVMGPDKIIRLRSVHLGVVSDGFAQLTDGVAAGEQVVVKGSLFVDKAGIPE